MKIFKSVPNWSCLNISVAAWNMFMAYVAFMLCRVVFFLVNYSTFVPYMSFDLFCTMLKGALVFDTSALLYLNSLYLLMTLFPCHVKENKLYHEISKWVYFIPNIAGVAANLADSVYFQYTGRRTTITVFDEFGNENNILSIIGSEVLRHWYLVVIFALIAFMLWKFFKNPSCCVKDKIKYYVIQALSIIMLVPVAIIGIRGSAVAGTRPITISNANQYVNRAVETSVVLNTPFSIIRTIGKESFEDPCYMSNEEMEKTFSPVMKSIPVDTLNRGKNVVILIVESLGKEYIGFYNRDLHKDGMWKGYAPFMDSIAANSLTYKYSYANGRKSMDAMPSILSAIPMFVEPFFLTPASLNDLSGLPSLLALQGYTSAFFHGGHNISMGFSAFAQAIGYDMYFGLDEYEKDKNYGGYADFDGKWAIWDEPFLQFSADRMNEMPKPFVATVFTATSHHPYKIPDEYYGVFVDEDNLEISKCIKYADMSTAKFFDKIKGSEWFKNTVFVIVADHTNQNRLAEYKTDLGLFSIPIIFYTPDGSIKPDYRDDVIAQQTDITPTILSYLGYEMEYVGFGCDLMNDEPSSTWAVNYNNGIYQFLKGDIMLQFDGEKVKAAYNFKSDPLLKHNLIGQVDCADMEHELKAIIQQYMQRMNGNNLVVR